MAKRTKQDKQLTKKQIAHSRRQRQQKMRVLLGVGVVVALILGVALAGLYDQLIAQPGRPVATVNGTRIRTDDYQSRVLYERFVLDRMLRDLQTRVSLLDMEDQTNQFLVRYYQQVAEQAYQQRLGVNQQALDAMIQEELVRQKAAELGLTVSEDEVNEAVRATVAAQSGYLTEAQATAIAGTAVAVTATAETFTPTPQPTPSPTLTATVVTTGTPATPPDVPTPGPTPTRHIMTDAEFNQDYASYLTVLSDQAGVSEAEYRAIVRARLLADEVRQYFADQVPTEGEQSNLSHIQVDTQEEAQAVFDRLEAGEDFALVASEVSSDTLTAANGGELGWLVEGELEPVFGPIFGRAAFSLSPGEYSQPISSALGWHIVKVNAREERALSEYQLQTRREQAYYDWLSEAKSSEGVEILWEPDMAPPDPLLEQSSSGLPAGGVPDQGGTQ